METLDFCTLGMFIIDDIYPPPSSPDQTPQKDVIGGAGTYSAVGARLMSPAPEMSKRIGWIADCGTDFPHEVRSTIDSWQTAALMRERDGRTTRGWNGYGANEHRAFKYLTPKRRLTAEDLTPQLLRSKSFHLICGPSRAVEMVEGIQSRRKALDSSLGAAYFVWEPVPDLCVTAELENTLEAFKSVDVISPNHAELAALFDFEATDSVGNVNNEAIETAARRLLEAAGTTSEKHVVVRCGKDGCCVATNASMQTSSQEPNSQAHNIRWLPAYHDQTQHKVVDPTGGGNGFLGGFAVGLVRTGNVIDAALYGSVSASLCIEQVGMPVLAGDVAEGETWNGVDVAQRLRDFRLRCGIDDPNLHK